MLARVCILTSGGAAALLPSYTTQSIQLAPSDSTEKSAHNQVLANQRDPAITSTYFLKSPNREINQHHQFLASGRPRQTTLHSLDQSDRHVSKRAR